MKTCGGIFNDSFICVNLVVVLLSFQRLIVVRCRGHWTLDYVAAEDSDSDSEDESDESETEEESDAETSGLDLDVCPPGCDQQLYDNTCLLREKRLDVEEQLAEERQTKDSMIKELDVMHKRAKLTESAMKTVELELQSFQVRAPAAFFIYAAFKKRPTLSLSISSPNTDRF